MKTDELREKYLEFFESKGCVRRPTDLLVPTDDPTVLFTPAGMNQFKQQFLGIGPLDFTRATTCQKCLRTGDIENVGVTAYHHTFFEMLGNFSFGDYFKKEAIHWAWEFLTDKKWLGLDGERLTVTVYLDDDEAFNIWHDEIKLPANRIRRDDEHENFWPAGAPSDGPDGVCGPCSEIFYHPPQGGKEVEIWNLVFTQFNRAGDPPDNLKPLPKNNIDTGMGLERTAAVLQGKISNFEIDILRPVCEAAGEILGVNYQFEGDTGRALRRIADHTRAVSMCLHEGVEPGPKKEKFIVRLLLRRAAMEGYLLGQESPFLHQLVPVIVDMMKAPYPELKATVDAVCTSMKAEEEQFFRLMDQVAPRVQSSIETAKSTGQKFSGDEAFDLHQAHGVPIEVVRELTRRVGVEVDMDRFKERQDEHERVSKEGATLGGVMAAGPMDAIRAANGDTKFLGYETDTAAGKILGLFNADGESVSSVEKSNEKVGVILDQTPFYAESGGQVGDLGTISCASGTLKVDENTIKKNGLTVHFGTVTEGKLSVGDSVTASIDADRRGGIQRAHSATHLLHHALRTTLGEQAMQRGSKVDNDVFRFDFSHGSSLNPEELEQVENIINARIAEGADVSIDFMKIEEAKAAGAMALFGEKYPDNVRVVSIGEFSKELCGGTHLTNTGQVGLCKIISEESLSSGVRRISVLTGAKALERIRGMESTLNELSVLLKTPEREELPRRVSSLQQEVRDLKRELAKQTSQSLGSEADELIANAEEVNGVKIITHHPQNVTREALRDFVDQIRNKVSPVALVLGTEIDGKVALIAAVSKDLVKRGIKASDCVKAAAQIAGGGGGGRPDMAEAGGTKPEKIDEALTAGATFYREKLASA